MAALGSCPLPATMPAMRPTLPVVLLSLATTLAAQEQKEARFRIGLGLGGGDFDYETDGSNLDDKTSAGLFRLLFEGTSRQGIGGGIRLESSVSDDDMFVSSGFPRTEASNGSMFAHFTYRLDTHRFAMPMRAGFLLNDLTLAEQATDNEINFFSFGPYFELAPEVVLVRGGSTQWSLFGEFGFGFGGTAIDIDGDSRDYNSVTTFGGIELGTRVLLGPIELGLSWVGRWQSMDESDPEGGQVVLPYDANFQGGLISFAVVF